tara:strand:- start:906 stop:1085 length:180 start_codon:yes stop_codon:yes gene_type:complete
MRMNISEAQYMKDLEGENNGIRIVEDGVTRFVPMTKGNRHYDEVLRQVEAGTLTIKDAD